MHPVVIVVEQFSIFVGLDALVTCLIRRYPKNVYYIDTSAMGGRFARLLTGCGLLNVTRLDFHMVDIVDQSGNAVNLRIEVDDLSKIQAQIQLDPLFQATIKQWNGGDEFGQYLAKKAVTRDYDADTMGRIIYLIQVLVWSKKSLNAEEVVFLSYRRPWQDIISAYAASHGVHIQTYHRMAVPWRSIGISFLGSNYFWLGNTFRYLKKFGLRHWDRVNRTPTTNRPHLWVESTGNLNMGRPEAYSDLFFFRPSHLNGADLLLTFRSTYDPLNQSKLEECARNAITPIALDPNVVTTPEASVYIGSPEGAMPNPFPLFWRRQWNQLKYVREYYYQREYWLAFIKKNSIKLFLTWFRYDARHIIMSDALRCANGISCIYQRSIEDLPAPRLSINADVVFSFSNYSLKIQQESHSRIPYHIITGYIGDHRFPLLREPARQLREKLLQRGAERVITFFDEGSTPDTRWHYGDKFMQENYAFLIEKIIHKKKIGIIFKPKIPSTLRTRLGPVATLLQSAEQTGRCIVLDGGGAIHGSYPPAYAALASDVAIHGHFCAATAGFEAALAGTPTLLLDRERWNMSPFSKLGRGTVVFSDWSELWEAYEQYIMSPSAHPLFGNWSTLLNELDTFRDGRGAERMGLYLQWLLEGLNSGKSRDRVLEDAAHRYRDQWGPSMVSVVG